MFGRTLRSNLAIDNGRSAEFIRRKSYPDKSRCYECGEDGHLSYKCPKNALGERDPPPKKDKRRKKENSKAEKSQVCSFMCLHFQTCSLWEPPTVQHTIPTPSVDELQFLLLRTDNPYSRNHTAKRSIYTPWRTAASTNDFQVQV
jgi:hypothetical protein